MSKLVNGGEIVLRCKNCNEGLCCILITRPDADLTWRVMANCYKCKKKSGRPESSFEQTIKGAYYIGGYGINNPNDTDDADMKTVVVNCSFVGDILVYDTKEYIKNEKK